MDSSQTNMNIDLLLDAAKPSIRRLNTLKTQHSKVYQSIADYQKHQKSLLLLDSYMEIPEDQKKEILANHSKARHTLISHLKDTDEKIQAGLFDLREKKELNSSSELSSKNASGKPKQLSRTTQNLKNSSQLSLENRIHQDLRKEKSFAKITNKGVGERISETNFKLYKNESPTKNAN